MFYNPVKRHGHTAGISFAQFKKTIFESRKWLEKNCEVLNAGYLNKPEIAYKLNNDKYSLF